MKRCATCGDEKAYVDFYKDSTRSKDGYSNICKKCSFWNSNRLERLKAISEKTCNICKQIKPLNAFIRDNRRTLRVGLICLDCSSKKRCRKCNELKDLEDFYASPRSADGHQYRCKRCQGEASYDREKKRRDNDPTRAARLRLQYKPRKGTRGDRLWRSHKLTLDEYQTMLDLQNGKCYICKAIPGERGRPYLAVDHDHQTNDIRGLLCDPCNRALGMFKDSTTILMQAIDYLNKEPYRRAVYQHFG